MRSLQFANASGKFQINRKSRWVSPYKPHRPWATSGSGHTIPERILNWAIVSLKWFGWRSNQIVVSNWLLFASSSEEWLDPKIKLLVQSDSLASRLSFQDQMLLKFREDPWHGRWRYSLSPLQVSNNSPLEFGGKTPFFSLRIGQSNILSNILQFPDAEERGGFCDPGSRMGM